MGLFYNTGSSVAVAAGTNLPFTTLATANTPGAFTHLNPPGQHAVQVNTAGTYYISYSVPVSTVGQASIVIDPPGAPPAVVGQAGRSRSAAGVHMLVGWTIETLAANTTVGVRNSAAAAFTTSTAAQGGLSGELYLQKVG